MKLQLDIEVVVVETKVEVVVVEKRSCIEQEVATGEVEVETVVALGQQRPLPQALAHVQVD